MLTVTQLAHHWPLSDSSTIDLLMCSTSCSPCSLLPTGTNPTRNQYDHEPLHSCLSNDNQAWADGSPSHLCVGERWTCRSRVEGEGEGEGGTVWSRYSHTFFLRWTSQGVLIAEIARCASGRRLSHLWIWRILQKHYTPHQIKCKTTDIPARHIAPYGGQAQDACIFVSWCVVRYVLWNLNTFVKAVLFQRDVMSLAPTDEERGGSSGKKKVEWIIFFVARLELYAIKIRVRAQCMCVCLLWVTWAESPGSSPAFEPGCLHQVYQCWSPFEHTAFQQPVWIWLSLSPPCQTRFSAVPSRSP